jgi:predicted phage tail protein
MMVTVCLHGHLREAFGAEFRFDVETVGEIFAALHCNLPGFRRYLIEHSEPGYRVVVNDEPRTAEELALVVSVPSEIHVVPVVQGAGDGKGIGMILGGILLAVVTYGAGAAIGAGAAAGSTAATLGSVVANVGVGVGLSMAVGGVSQLISRQPSAAEGDIRETERRKQYTFGGTSPTVTEGYPLALHYGEVFADGIPVSVRLVVENDVG